MTRRGLIGAALALALGITSFVAVMGAQKNQGVARDEVVYMTYGSKYAAWWDKLLSGKEGMTGEKAISEHFGGAGATANNREHPPLMKTLMGFSEKMLHQKLGVLDRISAYRAPSAAMNALLVVLMFLFVRGIWGWTAGVVAALATLFLPRAFFHAGVAAFDAAVVTMWMATLMAYYRALSSWRWCVVLGVVWGLALATKHNALMLPAVMVPHYVWVSLRSGRGTWQLRAGRGIWGRIERIWLRLWSTQPLMFPALFVLGPLVFVAVWPWLWFDTVAHVRDWIGFHLHHVHYNYEYLGKNWNAPPYPWHVPFLTTLLTVPVATLVAAALGLGVLWRRWRACVRDRADIRGTERDEIFHEAPGVLLLLSVVVAMGPFVLGQAPIFGAEKHWAPAIPALCAFAGLGVAGVAELLGRGLCEVWPRACMRQRLFVLAGGVVLGGVVIGAALVETWASRPYGLSHYNALAGGVPGGADLGMNRQFWGYAARGVLPYLNDRAPVSGQAKKPVYSHDASPAWGVYARAGLLASGLGDAGHEAAGIRASRFALVIHERHFARHDYMIWDDYGTVQPAFVLTFQGVPLVSVYARPEKPPGR